MLVLGLGSSFHSATAGPSYRVDGRLPTLVDGKLLLDPGEHTVRLSAAGFEAAERRISARPRENGFLQIALSPETVPQAVPVAPVGDEPPGPERSVAKSQVGSASRRPGGRCANAREYCLYLEDLCACRRGWFGVEAI